MSWAKLDDQFHAHRKAKRAWTAHPRALGLHLLAMSYCAGHLTDGLVDDEFVAEKLPQRRERGQVTDALVDARLWVREDDGWRINDWLTYNPSRADVMDKRRKEAERKARGRATQSARSPNGVRADVTRTPAGSGAESDGPDPTRPVNSPPVPPRGGRARDRAHFADGIAAYVEQRFPHLHSTDAVRAVQQAVMNGKAATDAEVDAFLAEHWPQLGVAI